VIQIYVHSSSVSARHEIIARVAMRFGMPGTPTELNPTSQVLTLILYMLWDGANNFYDVCMRTSLSCTLLPYVVCIINIFCEYVAWYIKHHSLLYGDDVLAFMYMFVYTSKKMNW
jgi:hypothetical protein